MGLDVTMESCKNTQRRPHELPCNLVDSLKRTKRPRKVGEAKAFTRETEEFKMYKDSAYGNKCF